MRQTERSALLQFVLGTVMSTGSLLAANPQPALQLCVNVAGCAVLGGVAWAWRPLTDARMNQVTAFNYGLALWANVVSLVALADWPRAAAWTLVALLLAGWLALALLFAWHGGARFRHPGTALDQYRLLPPPSLSGAEAGAASDAHKAPSGQQQDESALARR